MQQIYDFLKSCGTYFIATVEDDQPRVRPFGTINIFEDKLYIQSGHIKPFAKQVEANPKTEICAFNGNEWIRISATLAEDTRIEPKKAMLDAYPNLRSMYDENDANTAVYYLKEGVATISSFTKEPVVVKI
ncbi:MAG: pyridoxamine 5'-phosphate oxidase family protein [Bacteroidales bacterium]|nr:pyridoxamine 5'-phosphate oxidase family protein [Bacteroidales bacterium]